MAPTLELLSEVFADNNNIVVAKLDCETNDVDRTCIFTFVLFYLFILIRFVYVYIWFFWLYKYLPETSIPNIKLFTAANKKEPIKYKGNRTLEDFIQFLHTNAT